jgi:chemotaxis protein MotA
MDLASVIGLVVALGMILAGNAIEGGRISQIAQPTAAMIVIGGTIGATMLQFPLPTFIGALKQIKSVFFTPASRDAKLVEEIVGYAATARRDGILALEPLAPKASDPFLVRALMMAIDGADSNAIRDALEQAIHKEEEEGEDTAKVFETAGGYAPTIGIIGAVLGLIQVMQNLSDIAKVGEGIATAFVATIYGVGFANLVCLPIGGKLKLRTRASVALRTLMLEGALAIQQGMNPKLVKERLASFTHDHGSTKEAAPVKEAA